MYGASAGCDRAHGELSKRYRFTAWQCDRGVKRMANRWDDEGGGVAHDWLARFTLGLVFNLLITKMFCLKTKSRLNGGLNFPLVIVVMGISNDGIPSISNAVAIAPGHRFWAAWLPVRHPSIRYHGGAAFSPITRQGSLKTRAS